MLCFTFVISWKIDSDDVKELDDPIEFLMMESCYQTLSNFVPPDSTRITFVLPENGPRTWRSLGVFLVLHDLRSHMLIANRALRWFISWYHTALLCISSESAGSSNPCAVHALSYMQILDYKATTSISYCIYTL